MNASIEKSAISSLLRQSPDVSRQRSALASPVQQADANAGRSLRTGTVRGDAQRASESSLWSTLTPEERAYYASHAGPITYRPRVLHGQSVLAEHRIGVHLDVRG